MKATQEIHAKFSRSLLHPRYWLTWFGIGILYLLVLLPYGVIYQIGKTLGLLSMKIAKRRVVIATRNLELCFPDKSEQERAQLLRENFISTGIAIFETGMAWFWSDRRIAKHSTTIGVENILEPQEHNQGVLLVGIHFLTLELGARIIGLARPGIGVYRPNDNPVMDYVQIKGRLKSNKYMLDRRNLKGMIRSLKQGEMLWYAPDHDYGPKNSVFVPFFAVEKAATTVGTSILVKMADPNIVPFTPKRDKKGYTLVIQPALVGFPKDDETAAAAFMNKAIEKEILQAPEQYMWLHRRFKTRPKGEPSLYD
ncbi:Kdo(2)-lipid IV(A) acyltransferase [Zophobihabitans entericus]|uniref:Lipid A biosynthesis acyltransferase n=1 Tax=Zophobihabitans entericus TaxID=1635327 RepID=A0A6G9IEP4_9GAMM|nr:Kdo(2)-lipid IV(A) acyltransferase [Zophobihabitans entericus]QIQ22292.1 LpxL/LpxP family Kdo(2)-lipid IV(A) lauroyl/palmitoleoyl acyltransferasee [Zophobihabitans entericus]